MKKLFLLFAASTFLFASCNNAPEGDKTEATDAKEVAAATGATYNADLTESKVMWTGTKPVGKHNGTINLQSGTVSVANNEVTGGKFILDIKTLVALDQDSAGNAMLTGHLLSPDFFDAEKFATASFEITSVTPGVQDTAKLVQKDATHTITGNLELKGVSKSISFPAKIAVSDAQVSTDANFNIDRTQWSLNYGNDKSLGDKFIHPEVNIQLHIVAKK